MRNRIWEEQKEARMENMDQILTNNSLRDYAHVY